MKLQYDRKDLVRILDSDNFSVATFNNVVQRFIQNDLKFIASSGDIPGTWENRWFNSPGDTSLAYSKGAAVWINCYSDAEFVRAKWSDIESYVSQNGSLQAEYLEIKEGGDTEAMAAFFRKVVRGYAGNPPLYYLGDLDKPIQIRISLVDGNMYPPSDEYTLADGRTANVYWRDFFMAQSRTEIVKGIFDYFHQSDSERRAQHEAQYHLVDLDSPESFMSQRMHADFSNAVYKQRMKSHYWFDNKLENGFDTVVKFARRKLDSGGSQWFRLWRSGYLEHGGMVGLVDARDPVSGVELFDERFIRVNFAWKYEQNTQTAPIYDYPTDLLNRVYAGETNVDIGTSGSNLAESVQMHFQMPRMGSTYKYSLVVNALLTDGTTDWESMPQPFMQCGDPNGLKYRSQKDIFDQGNDGFSFSMNSQASRYSYYASGFVAKRQ